LIENFNATSKDELIKQENFYINTIKCVNKQYKLCNIPIPVENYIEIPDKIKIIKTDNLTAKQKSSKKFYENNKDLVKHRSVLNRRNKYETDTEMAEVSATETLIPTFETQIIHRKKYKRILKEYMKRVLFLIWLNIFDEVMKEYTDKAVLYFQHKNHKAYLASLNETDEILNV
jgi:hypothetical protein